METRKIKRHQPNRDLREETLWAEALFAVAQAASTAAMQRRRELSRHGSPKELARVEKRWEAAAKERDRQQERLWKLRRKARVAPAYNRG